MFDSVSARRVTCHVYVCWKCSARRVTCHVYVCLGYSICVLNNVKNQESDLSCICVFEVLSQDSDLSCICVLGV